ncbi:hypothetical protein H5410_014881 [Solanum commersonii]|uniref:Uncharacterized protein n=1 Tax=Solanum commersonii TaxID=4109 RepID=A0A9J5ZS65_SOLCO|nr:hypothetical protein H5410_014881 [Solanum commersonii]
MKETYRVFKVEEGRGRIKVGTPRDMRRVFQPLFLQRGRN